MPVDATQPYDEANVFARILRGELPARRVLETPHSLAFHDIQPWAPHHVLVIPKGAYVSWDDFSARATDAEIVDFVRAVGAVARAAGLVEPGYRLIANIGRDGAGEVPHLHVHVLAGRHLGPMLLRDS
jgi:histidine triad (HIT) family protein